MHKLHYQVPGSQVTQCSQPKVHNPPIIPIQAGPQIPQAKAHALLPANSLSSFSSRTSPWLGPQRKIHSLLFVARIRSADLFRILLVALITSGPFFFIYRLFGCLNRFGSSVCVTTSLWGLASSVCLSPRR